MCVRGLTPLVVAILCAGCSDAQIGDPLDYQPVVDGASTASGFSAFEASRLVSDDAFFDAAAVSGDQVQAFLESTPYGTRSFLADQTVGDGERLADALVRIAQAHALNPLVLLVTLQKESGLISAESSPGGGRVDFAMGCGCPDGSGCQGSQRGLLPQIECAGTVLERYAADLDGGGTTIAGIRPGLALRTSDRVRVVPANRATAVLYTYTPWVLRGSGGNWLFWNIWRRYAGDLDYPRGLTFPLNEGYIGGPCDSADDCFYPDAVCLPPANGGHGVCSMSCTGLCPDHGGSGWATTFCADMGGAGFCLAQCDASAPTCNGADTCEAAARPSDPSAQRDVCMPAR